MLCKYCGEDKPEREFGISKVVKGVTYQRRRCNACKYIAQNKRVLQIKEWFYDYKSHLVCSNCQFSDFRALQFHHRNPEEKLFNIGDAIKSGYSIENIKKEIEKCDVLCANCHSIKHYDERILDIDNERKTVVQS